MNEMSACLDLWFGFGGDFQALGLKNGHEEAKGILQMKYFGFERPDLSIPLFAFIGRITQQKGVHLILDAAETYIKRYQHKIQILVGGMCNYKEPYSARCAHKMWDLRNRFRCLPLFQGGSDIRMRDF